MGTMPRITWLLATVLAALLPSTPMTFREVPSLETGITWMHVNGHSDKRYLPETIPPGVAIFDYNNDGWMDILFVNSGESKFFHPRTALRSALYRNNRDGTFTDVTEKAGLTANLFGMGVAIEDYDGDGFGDVFLTGYGKSTTLTERLRKLLPRAGSTLQDGPPALSGSIITMT